MSKPRARRRRVIHPADATRLADADRLREEIERRLARIRTAYVSAEAAGAAYAEADQGGANPALPR